MILDRSLLDAIPLEAVGKVIDIDWSKVFTFEEFPDCQHTNKKDEINCTDCVEKLYSREKWLEQTLSKFDDLPHARDENGKDLGPITKVRVIRGKYQDCIGIITEL
jgi:hypothetical protein